MVHEKQLRVIDQDFIRELKRTGKRSIAMGLIRAFRKDIATNKIHEGRQYDKQLYIVKKTMGICTSKFCLKKAKKNHNFCEKHREQHNRRAKTHYRNKKHTTNGRTFPMEHVEK